MRYLVAIALGSYIVTPQRLCRVLKKRELAVQSFRPVQFCGTTPHPWEGTSLMCHIIVLNLAARALRKRPPNYPQPRRILGRAALLRSGFQDHLVLETVLD